MEDIFQFKIKKKRERERLVWLCAAVEQTSLISELPGLEAFLQDALEKVFKIK